VAALDVIFADGFVLQPGSLQAKSQAKIRLLLIMTHDLTESRDLITAAAACVC
jgi:hypothetical protein